MHLCSRSTMSTLSFIFLFGSINSHLWLLVHIGEACTKLWTLRSIFERVKCSFSAHHFRHLVWAYHIRRLFYRNHTRRLFWAYFTRLCFWAHHTRQPFTVHHISRPLWPVTSGTLSEHIIQASCVHITPSAVPELDTSDALSEHITQSPCFDTSQQALCLTTSCHAPFVRTSKQTPFLYLTICHS
jgi:hypothetical protein